MARFHPQRSGFAAIEEFNHRSRRLADCKTKTSCNAGTGRPGVCRGAKLKSRGVRRPTGEKEIHGKHVITAIVGIIVLIGVMFTFNTLIFNLVIAPLRWIAIHDLQCPRL